MYPSVKSGEATAEYRLIVGLADGAFVLDSSVSPLPDLLSDRSNRDPILLGRTSSVSGRQSNESDVDVAVYLSDPTQEDRIWRDLTQRLQSTVDLVRMDRSPATLNSAVFKEGIPLVIRDRRLYRRLCLDQTLEAEDFAEFAREYAAVMRRSASLSPEDETRVRERLALLQAELRELDAFSLISREGNSAVGVKPVAAAGSPRWCPLSRKAQRRIARLERRPFISFRQGSAPHDARARRRAVRCPRDRT
jgi:hypothetical protein